MFTDQVIEHFCEFIMFGAVRFTSTFAFGGMLDMAIDFVAAGRLILRRIQVKAPLLIISVAVLVPVQGIAGTVSLSKTALSAPWRVGQLTSTNVQTTGSALYQIVVTNSGTGTAGVTVTDTLPRGLFPAWEVGTPLSTGGFTCTYAFAAGTGVYTVTCAFASGPMGSESVHTIQLPVWVDQLATGTVSNTATSVPGVGSSTTNSLINEVATVAAANSCTALNGVRGSNLFPDEGSFGSLASNTVGSTVTTSNSGPTPLPAGTTTLTYRLPGERLIDGQYRLANRLNSYTTQRDYEWFWTVGDHTSLATNGGKGDPNGLMMVINASDLPSVFYQQTVAVTANTNYEFGLWAIQANNPNAHYWRGRPPKPYHLEIAVNRIGVDDDNDGVIDEPGEAQILVGSGDVAATAIPTWRQYAALFNPGAATQVVFIFRNNGPGGDGNDLGIDDLTLATCSNLPSTSISGTLYYDDNANNVLDGAESGRLPANITVELLDVAGMVVGIAQTDINGQYVFQNIATVPSAAYRVRVSSTDTDIPAGVSLGTDNPVPLSLAANTPATANFGYDRSRLQLRKTWVNAALNDQATLDVVRAGSSIGGFVATAGTANETDVSGSVITVIPGETLSLAEVLSGAGQYKQTLACDSGSVSGAELTVAPAAGALTTCTFTNTRAQANLSITKTNGLNQVVSGSSTTYTIVVTNNGPDSVTGAVVNDSPGAGLTCPANAAVSCVGSACPSGALTFSNLTAGVTLGALAAAAGSNSVTLSVACSID